MAQLPGVWTNESEERVSDLRDSQDRYAKLSAKAAQCWEDWHKAELLPGLLRWVPIDLDVKGPFFGMTNDHQPPVRLMPRKRTSWWRRLRYRVGEWLQWLGRWVEG